MSSGLAGSCVGDNSLEFVEPLNVLIVTRWSVSEATDMPGPVIHTHMCVQESHVTLCPTDVYNYYMSVESKNTFKANFVVLECIIYLLEAVSRVRGGK